MKQEEEVHFTIVSTLYSLTDKLTVGCQEELVGVENEGDTSSCKMGTLPSRMSSVILYFIKFNWNLLYFFEYGETP